MSRLTWIGAGALGLLALAIPAEAETRRLALSHPSAAAIEAFADKTISEAMARDHIAGVVVSVVQGGETVLLKGYGHADIAAGRPADPRDTLFRIGSISKTFTWIGALQLAERGQLDLDTDVNVYLPEALQIDYALWGGPVTMRDLMAHRGGFDDSETAMFSMNAERALALPEFLARHKSRLVRAPRTFSSYSNYGAALAGEISARRAGMGDFETYMETAILGPAGLVSTSFREPHLAGQDLASPLAGGLAARLSKGYLWTGASLAPQPQDFISAVAPAGSASSTAHDMARYMRLILARGNIDGLRVYGDQTAALIDTPIVEGAPGLNGWRHGFLSRSGPGGIETFGHNGATVFFNANMVLVPTYDLGIFLAANSESGGTLTEAFWTDYLNAFYPAPKQDTAGKPIPSSDLTELAGTYRMSRRPHSGLARFIWQLQADITLSPGDKGTLVLDAGDRIVFGASKDADRLVATGDGKGSIEFLNIVRDETGRPVRLIPNINALAFERIAWWQTRGVLISSLAGVIGVAVMVWAGVVLPVGVKGRRPERVRVAVLRSAGLAWLAGMGCFFVWVLKTEDPAYVVTHWPGAWLTTAAAFWWFGAALSLASLIGAIGVWKSSPAGTGWGWGRKAGYTAAALLNSVFALVLVIWGALGVHFGLS